MPYVRFVMRLFQPFPLIYMSFIRSGHVLQKISSSKQVETFPNGCNVIHTFGPLCFKMAFAHDMILRLLNLLADEAPFYYEINETGPSNAFQCFVHDVPISHPWGLPLLQTFLHKSKCFDFTLIYVAEHQPKKWYDRRKQVLDLSFTIFRN